jgi:hypothetical protein
MRAPDKPTIRRKRRPEGSKTVVWKRDLRELNSPSRFAALLASVVRERLRRKGLLLQLETAAEVAEDAVQTRTGRTLKEDSVYDLLRRGKARKRLTSEDITWRTHLGVAFLMSVAKVRTPEEMLRLREEFIAALERGSVDSI